MALVTDGIASGIDRKPGEERLREQQEWLRVTLASIGDAVIATDAEGRVTFLNPVAQDLTGWTQEDAHGQPLETVFVILNEQTRQPVENPVETVLQNGVVVGLGNHTVLIARNGAERPIDDSAAPIRNAAGEMIGVVLIFRDVTDQRRAEREVRQSEARKSAILETALDCIITMDHEGKVVEFNPAAEKTFGYRRAEVIGQDLASLIIPPPFRDRHRIGMAHHLATGEGPVLGKRLELPALRADGTEFPVELAITRIPTDGPPLFTAYLRDISERTRAEQHRNTRLAVTQVLAQARGIEAAATGILRSVCESLSWDVGFFWAVDLQTEGLVCKLGWHRPDQSITEFETDSYGRMFRRGEGLPGHVWAKGEPAWILDVSQDANFPRAASAAHNGLHGAFACPIVVGNRTLGVIEFFTKRIREPDADLLEMMATIAGQFAQFMERQQTEYALRRSEGRFRGLMEQAPFSVQVFSPDGRTIRVNRAWEELWGVTLDQIGDYNILEDQQLATKGVLDFIHRGFAGETVQIPAVRYDPNETIPDKSRHSDPRRWVSAMIYPLKDAAGQIMEVVLVHDDITARKLAEDAVLEAHRDLENRVAERTAELVQANEFLKALLENVQTGVVACDSAGVLTLFNSVTRALHGLPEEPLPPEEWAGRYCLYQADGQTPMAIKDVPLYRALQGERVHDAEMVIAPLGVPPRTVLTSGQAFFDTHGKKLGAVASMQDITARKQAEAALQQAHDQLEERVAERTAELGRANAALKESEEKLRLLADTIPQLAWMARPDGSIFWYNRRWYEYTGTTPEQMDGWGWQSVHDPEVLPRVLERWKGSIASGEPFDMVFPLKGANEEFRPFLTRVNPLRDEEGRILYWFGTNTDISDIKRMEEALRDADRRKDEFLATLAHELRNPLAPIRNSLQILKMPRVDSATVQKVRDMMERQVHHLVRLVDDLLDVSRVMRGKIELRKERVELASVVARAVETAQALIGVQGHQLNISLPPESLLVDADPVRLAQVIGNLLTNSAKYTEANGHIWLSGRRERGDVVLRVRDDGIGIAPDMLPHVFELFMQVDHASTKAQGGLGIGLTLVKNLVELHGGTVKAHSAGLGKGCEFVVRLPLLVQEGQEPSEKESGEQWQDNTTPLGHRLLVVDDNHDAAISLSVLLRLQGHEVRVAHDGPSALEIATTFRPDIIFLDIGMPGMDGYQVARRLRQQPGLEKVVLAALTGWGQQEDRRRSAEAGFDHHLVKPPEPEVVQRLLADLGQLKSAAGVKIT